MNYFELLDDIMANFRVSKMIEIVKLEQDIETKELLVVAYEATRALIIVAKYKVIPDIEMPSIQGFSQMDFIKQIINLEAGADKSSVKFKQNDEGVAISTTFKIDNTTIVNKNVAKSLLPITPLKLNEFKPDFEIDLDAATIADVVKKLSLSMFNASVFITRNKNGNLSLKLTNAIDVVDIELPFPVKEGMLKDPFNVELEKLLAILKIGSTGVKFAVSDKQKLARIVKDNDTAEYTFFLIKKNHVTKI